MASFLCSRRRNRSTRVVRETFRHLNQLSSAHLRPKSTSIQSCNIRTFLLAFAFVFKFFVIIFQTQTFCVCVTYAYHVPWDRIVFVMCPKMTGVYCPSKPIVPLLQQYCNYYISLVHFNPIKWVKETYEINDHCVIRLLSTSCRVTFEL